MVIAYGSIIHSDMHALTHSFSKDIEDLPQAGPYVGVLRFKDAKKLTLSSRGLFPVVLVHRDLFLLTPELTIQQGRQTCHR